MNYTIIKETMKKLCNTSFAPKNHTKNLCPWMVFLFLCISQTTLADNTGFIEVRADRVVLYPQRMELRGGETLKDVLEMYPELLVGGYSDILNNYQLRMDNVKMSGDVSQLLMQIKAKYVKSVQIVDNPGVAKGTTGMGGVIDITLMPMTKGVHGFAEARGETRWSISPTANLQYGGGNTDLWVNTNYAYISSDETVTHQEYADIHGVTKLGERDRLLTYIKQEYCNSDASPAHNINRNCLARVRYFHRFNDMGTELLTLLSYQYTDAPHSSSDFREKSTTQVPMYLLELNSPLFTKDFTMMLGAEGDFNMYDYGVRQGGTFDETSRYDVFNQDFYLQLNYAVGAFNLTVGDRIMLYHYGMNGYSGRWSGNTTRNMFQSSVIYRPCDKHQLQLGYYRKFINPAYLDVFPEEWPNADGTLYMGNPTLTEEKVEQVKLGYTYSAKRLSVCVNENYFKRENGNIWRSDVSVYYKYNRLSVTAGVNAHNEKGSDYYSARISPKASLPYKIQMAANFIYYSTNAPYKQLTGASVYGELRANKQFNGHWDVQLLWHDMFASNKSCFMASVRYNY